MRATYLVEVLSVRFPHPGGQVEQAVAAGEGLGRLDHGIQIAVHRQQRLKRWIGGWVR